MPSPWIIRSVLRPVVWLEPWLKLVLVAASWTPSPTWIGLLPPRLAAALGEEPEVSICDSVSEKTVELDLKPTVLALAMLLPVTSSMTWLTRRPLMPAKRERSMVVLLDSEGLEVVVSSPRQVPWACWRSPRWTGPGRERRWRRRRRASDR